MDKTVIASDILAEFFEVAIHLILYVRHLYPSNIFEKKKKCNVPVQMSIHPTLNKYIEDVVGAVKVMLTQNHVEKIAVCIFNKDHKPVEKFVFEVSIVDNRSEIEDAYLIRLEQAIRAFYLKIGVCEAMLTPLPKDCYFGIQMHTSESAALSLDEEQVVQEFPWIEADPEQTKLENSHIVPLKSLEHEIFQMQLYVQESDKKQS